MNAFKAVFWSFFGVRKRSDYEADTQRLKPQHVIAAGEAHVLIRGKKYPVVGRVCMDQIMVNLEWETAYNGDVVTLLGADGAELITCEHLADWAGTIPYEVLTNLNTRIPRVYV